ncbi:MAG TPA: hypothetical protein VMT85_00175 [Thermoanaerobaculia bacterium]|nr:hypothetical protein [Thermoanaerobaculia bacterium]
MATPPVEASATSDGSAKEWQRWAFDDDPLGSPPQGFTPVHSGQGAQGEWRVVEALDAPSGRQAVAQLDDDRTGNRFPLLVLDSLVGRDVELEVVGKPISGRKDQAMGVIWRYQDADNYYVLRANALEDNVVLYKMEAGKRSDLDLLGRGRTYGLDVEVPPESWSRLGVVVRGNLFTAFLDGRELFQVEDDTFTGPGKVGLWTKADSVTWFDDFAVRILDPVESEPEPGE